MGIEQKVAVITGASQGIGAALGATPENYRKERTISRGNIDVTIDLV